MALILITLFFLVNFTDDDLHRGAESSSLWDIPGEEEEEYYVGNCISSKFHRADCSFVPGDKESVLFLKRADALEEGYIPCSSCKP